MKKCSKCGNKYPATTKYFYRDSGKKDGLRYWCKNCIDSRQKKYQQTKQGKIINNRSVRKYQQTEKGKNTEKKYRSTLSGYLRHKFQAMKRRCNNPECKDYKNYGGRGIKCLFESPDEFVDYVKNNLGVKTIDQIKGLQIDRINNNGHYEKCNIRFVTAKENNNNRRDNLED